MSKKALYLAGGGARGAYQAGVLKGIYSILKTTEVPFELITGVSVGSMNACIMAQNAAHFKTAVEQLEDLWCSIKGSDIYNASRYDLTKSLMRNFGLLFKGQIKSGYLIDTTPLTHYIQKNINFKKITKNIDAQIIKNIELIATCYDTQQNISFCQVNDPDFTHWQHAKHISHTTKLNTDHILASGALPLFFSPIIIDNYHFGDGSMGLSAPLRGILHSRADQILVISNRQPAAYANKKPLPGIGFAQILGSMLNGLFQDNLDRDIEIVDHISNMTDMVSMWNKKKLPWKNVPILHLRPTTDLAHMALDNESHLTEGITTLLKLFGNKPQSGDLISFLLFEAPFTSELFHLGYNDTLDNTETILAFFNDGIS
jgi:NTE family protein